MKKRIQMIKYFPVFVMIFALQMTLSFSQREQVPDILPTELDNYIAYSNPEFRGMWITRFEWPSKDPEECKKKIIQVFDDMGKANFNMALFQVRGSADVLYRSSLEPWSPILDSKDPGFDPLELAITEAHKRGIQLHAYVNPMPLCSAGRDLPPKDTKPEHLYYRHGPESPEPWVCMDEQGKLMEARGAGYWYLSAGIPEVHAYLRNVLIDLVKRYDIDGLHFDRIRYPGPQYSHDPISTKRFYTRGNPNRKEWFDWQREQLDKLINDLYAEIMAEKPGVAVSCSAWGIYNRYHIEGYYNFSSGYHDYYQDTWNWVNLGAMDFLVPMIYWNIPDPKPNYNELVNDFVRGVGKEHFIGGQRAYGNQWGFNENVQEILFSRKAGIAGTVLFSYGSVKDRGGFETLVDSLYKNKAEAPSLTWKTDPKYGIILGTVTDEQGEPLQDAWVSLAPLTEERDTGREGRRGARRERIFRQTWTSSADGRFAFLKVPSVPLKLVVEYDGAPTKVLEDVKVSAGDVKKIKVTLDGAAKAKKEVFFHIFEPKDGSETTRDMIHIIGKIHPDHKIRIQKEPVEVFSTGAFVKDNIPVKIGENKIEITAGDGQTTSTRYLTVIRKEPLPPEEIKTLTILEPAEDLSLLPGESLEIKAKAPRGFIGSASLWNDKFKIPLTESRDENSTGIYTTVFKIPQNLITDSATFSVKLEKQNDASQVLQAESKAKIEVWDPAIVRVGETTDAKTAISFGTHLVRLGGPYLTEVPIGTRFEIIGRQGGKYKIKLSASLSGWLDGENVKMLPQGTLPPHAFFTSLSIGGDDKYDKLGIPVKDKVVFAITPETDPENCLYIDIFNSHFAATWISHKSGAQVIGTVTGAQIEDGVVRLKVPIKSKQIWGYWAERDAGGINIFVRRPPKIASPPDSPLKGLTIAIEAGHGGSGSGAVGYMGTNEKTINSNAVKAIRKIMEAKGAKVVEVRPGDSNPTLSKRVEKAIEANVDFFLSIHANAAGTERGFLRVSGTSTYFRDKQNELVARLVYDELLKLNWGEFGVVGNFHYYPLRETRIPSMLVEQAFMSHPGDEARLLDPGYQKAQAEAIVLGMEKFLDMVRE